ncbi:hypothetical protein [Streptomyces canus]|uniref:hypothetical protein n=1 Tax=Streptomyces canus TaxID=58343 RepID=UPI002E2541B5
MKLPDVSQLTNQIEQAPSWAMTAAAGAAALVLVLAVYIRSSRRVGDMMAVADSVTKGHSSAVRKTAAAAGPLAFLGACGMLVSLYGLYGFATVNMQLPVPFAIPFMAIWDIAEATCFVSLYRSALVENRWTRPMRQTRRTAWALVAASAAMNAAHAPGNGIAMAAFAAVPVVSAKLIEHELDKLLAANADEEEEQVTPGFVRLFQVGYVHVWAEIFARLQLDATTRDGIVHQEARIRRAARKVHELGRALDAEAKAKATNEGEGRKAKRDQARALEKAGAAVEEARREAESAIDVAQIAGDTPAQLMLARHLTLRGRVDDLARTDKSDPMAMVGLLEDLSIVPSAAAIEEGARAAMAKKERQEAEAARDAALAQQAEAEQAAEEMRRTAAADLSQAKDVLQQAQAKARKAEDAAEAAEERKAQAEEERQNAEAERTRIAKEIDELRSRNTQLSTTVNAGEARGRELASDVERLQAEADELRQQAATHRRTAEEARTTAQEAMAIKRAALAEVEQAKARVQQLADDAKRAETEARQLAERRQAQTSELDRLAAQRQEAEEAARTAHAQANRARQEAESAEETRRAAQIALANARDELLEALTSPEDTTAPRWTSPAKVRGWELYLHTVHNEGREPTDAELAGDDRDPSTARKWLPEFRAELARITAAALPAQKAAHERTADRAPALV